MSELMVGQGENGELDIRISARGVPNHAVLLVEMINGSISNHIVLGADERVALALALLGGLTGEAIERGATILYASEHNLDMQTARLSDADEYEQKHFRTLFRWAVEAAFGIEERPGT